MKANKRTRLLIADFVFAGHQSGKLFAKGWTFAVHDAFKDALDIKLTEVVVKQIKSKTWTQGESFSFAEGDIIHDTPDGHLSVTPDSNTAHIFIQIITAAPAGYNVSGYVRFQVFTRHSSPFSISRPDIYDCTQKEFVRLLQTGKFTQLQGSEDIQII